MQTRRFVIGFSREDTFYIIGTAAGPIPTSMVRDFQCIIGNEVRNQIQGFRTAS